MDRLLDFERFYEEKLLEIINKVEGDATRFSEEVTLLRRALNPPTVGADPILTTCADPKLTRGFC